MRVIVVGAGITGLATAWGLRLAGHDVVVVESGAHTGGVIASVQRDGFVLEQGAGSIRGGGPAVYRLLIDAGVASAVVPASEAARHRFLLHDGQLVAMPSGPGGIFGIPRLGRRGGLRLLQEPLIRRPWNRGGEETVHDFLARRVGSRAADALGSPLIAGITGGDPRQIEVDSTFPQWVGWERNHGSLVRGAMRERTNPPAGLPSGTFTLHGGIATLTSALTAQLGDRVHTDCPAEGLDLGPRSLVLHTAHGPFEADHIVLTTPPAAVRPLLTKAPANWLSDPPTASLAAIHLAYPSSAIPGGLNGFGWLAHHAARRDTLGCLWVSSTFPQHAPPSQHLLRLMVGGTRAPELADRSDDALIDHAMAVMADVQGIRQAPRFATVTRARIPQYPVGTARRLRLLDQLHPGVSFAGWWWGHMGVSAAATGAALLVRKLRRG